MYLPLVSTGQNRIHHRCQFDLSPSRVCPLSLSYEPPRLLLGPHNTLVPSPPDGCDLWFRQTLSMTPTPPNRSPVLPTGSSRDSDSTRLTVPSLPTSSWFLPLNSSCRLLRRPFLRSPDPSGHGRHLPLRSGLRPLGSPREKSFRVVCPPLPSFRHPPPRLSALGSTPESHGFPCAGYPPLRTTKTW